MLDSSIHCDRNFEMDDSILFELLLDVSNKYALSNHQLDDTTRVTFSSNPEKAICLEHFIDETML